MVDWAKKIARSVGQDIQADEQVEAGLFVQPSGLTAGMMGSQLGGLVGALMVDKLGGEKLDAEHIVTDEGIAATIPKRQPLVLGLTGRRLLVWGHGKMSGKPKGLLVEMPLDQVAGIQMEKQKLTHATAVVFGDGTGVFFEAPRIGKPDDFLETFNRLKG